MPASTQTGHSPLHWALSLQAQTSSMQVVGLAHSASELQAPQGQPPARQRAQLPATQKRRGKLGFSLSSNPAQSASLAQEVGWA
jgi:hypothetical protein